MNNLANYIDSLTEEELLAFFTVPPTEYIDRYEDEDVQGNIPFTLTKGYTDIIIEDCTVSSEKIRNPAHTWERNVIYIQAYSIVGIINTVSYCRLNNKTLKTGGSFHSFSEVLDADVLLDICYCGGINPSQKGFPKTISSFGKYQSIINSIIPANKNNYVNIPAGIKIWQLNEILCPVNTPLNNIADHRSLINMGGAAVQSFSGALSTGTHGSGGSYTAYHDMIRSMLIVNQKGEVIRLEKTEPFTVSNDIEIIDGKEYSVKRINDDVQFNSFLVSFGTLGILHSFITEVQPMKLLHEESKMVNWESIKQNITNNAQQIEYYYLQINPYKNKKTNKNSVLEKKVVTTNKVPSFRSPIAGRPSFPEIFANCGLSIALTRSLLNSGDLKLTAKLLEVSLKAQQDSINNGGQGYTDLTYQVWSAGTHKLKDIGTAIEFAFPVDQVASVIDKLFSFLDTIKPKYYLNGPIAIRFVKSSDSLFAPNSKSYYAIDGTIKQCDIWAYIELTRVNAVSKEKDEIEKITYKKLQAYLLELGGRPHWGLNFELQLDKNDLHKLYPNFNDWYKVYCLYNSDAIFSNSFTKAISLDPIASLFAEQ